MVRTPVCRNPRPTEEELKNAMHRLKIGRKSFRKLATETGIPRSTLHRYYEKFNLLPSPNDPHKKPCHGNQVLSPKQEEELTDYLIVTQEEGYGLSPKHLKKLVFSYCQYNNITMPPNWIEEEIAGPDWFGNFMKRNRRLSLRKPENTSQARCSALNPVVMNKFYDKVGELYEKHHFTADQIYNVDETNDPTVMDSNRVLSKTGSHQVFHYL